MKLVTPTGSASYRFGDAGAVKMICEAGFDGLDFSLTRLKRDDCALLTPIYKRHCAEMVKIAESYGRSFEQSHAPFPMHIPLNFSYNRKMMDRAKRSIEISGLLGVKICIVHPSGEFWFHRHKGNIDMFNALAPVAKDYGVKIALENMYGPVAPFTRSKKSRNICSTPEDFNALLDDLDPEIFTGCLDLGHCGLVRCDTADMIRKMGNKHITALHVHDNDFIDDNHTLPYQRNMDWDSILKALADTDYKGNFTFEADSFFRGCPDALIPASLRYMHDVGRYMISEIERYKNQPEEKE